MRFTTVIAAVLISVGCGKEVEKVEMVPLDKLPQPVMATAKEKLPDVKFDTAWKENEKENGEDVFEVRGKMPSGKTRDVKVTASGKVLELD